MKSLFVTALMAGLGLCVVPSARAVVVQRQDQRQTLSVNGPDWQEKQAPAVSAGGTPDTAQAGMQEMAKKKKKAPKKKAVSHAS